MAEGERVTCLHCGRRIAPFRALGPDRWAHTHTGREACGDYVGTWAKRLT